MNYKIKFEMLQIAIYQYLIQGKTIKNSTNTYGDLSQSIIDNDKDFISTFCVDIKDEENGVNKDGNEK